MDSHVKRLSHINDRLGSVAAQLQPSLGKAGADVKNGSTDSADSLPVLRDYNAIVNDAVAPFVVTSRKIGGELSTMADHLTRLFDAQRAFIRTAIQTKKPTNEQQIADLIKPQTTEIEGLVGR